MTKLLLVIALTILVTFAVATPVLRAGLHNFTATPTASRADLRAALEELLDRLDDMDDADDTTPTTYDI